ncbi:MAG: PadR family transcriptional regulator [Coriobacteriia bacterium]|nr:PadR family transcriptional regulator [Coriobacteriia bacterium]MCL2746855.1 PadR family transcriptional regulator [Coriobacteriia bacterium]MCL2870927.1 PadR family transcriptional regulator [Coriobacteriia bacterium]
MSELSSDVLRGYNDTIILSLLNKQDSYGYQLSKMIRETSQGSYVMKETTLYSAISRLEKTGLLQSYAGEITRGKPRTYYRLTDEGRKTLQEKINEWKQTKKVLSVFFEEERT